MIKKVYSLVVSENVINLLLIDDRVQDINGYIESYQNGREQGHLVFGFSSTNKAIYICVHRNSDCIRIYYGRYAMQSISDDAYSNSKIFGDDYDGAVDYIVELLMTETE